MIKVIKDTIFVREIRRIVNDKNLFLLIIFMPIFYAFFYGYLYKSNVINKVSLGIIDNDKTILSKKIASLLRSDAVLSIKNYDNLLDAERDLREQKITGYVILNHGMEKNIKKGKQVKLAIYINTSSFMLNNELYKRFSQVIQYINGSILTKYWMSKGYIKNKAIEKANPIRVDISTVSNAVFGYGNFVIIGLFILILQQLILIGVAESTAKEEEDKTFNDLFSLAEGDIFKVLIGKGLVYIIFFMVYYIFYLTLPYKLFKIPQNGNIFDLVLLAFPFLITVIELGLFFGSFFEKKIQALQFLALSSVPIFLASGYSWPYYMLPDYLKYFNYFIPTYFMSVSYQAITQYGANLFNVKNNFLILWLQTFFYAVILFLRYNFLLKNNDKN